MNCVICGKRFDAHRSDARYCSPKCRKRAQYAREANMKKSRSLMLSLEGGAMVQKLRLIAPAAAASVEKLITDYGVDLGEAAVKLALAAFYEGCKSARSL